ncbi:YbaN family protein [Gracilibacillus xinjiangensis]|uniref:YbaN family protein n=1 Tax=Gracilibacillus xinjiangensis TaxID=1193282 RepID=A0ABV8X1S0_9BACI
MRKFSQIVWMVGGLLSLAVGIVGVILPILPTTPLVILAAFCFGKSSPKLHNWIITNRYFGHYIADYQKGYGVPLRIKLFAILIVWTSVLFTLLIIPLFLVKIFMLIVAISVTIFILTSPLLKSKNP